METTRPSSHKTKDRLGYAGNTRRRKPRRVCPVPFESGSSVHFSPITHVLAPPPDSPITIQTKGAPGKGTKKSPNASNDEKEKQIKRRDTLRYNCDWGWRDVAREVLKKEGAGKLQKLPKPEFLTTLMQGSGWRKQLCRLSQATCLFSRHTSVLSLASC